MLQKEARAILNQMLIKKAEEDKDAKIKRLENFIAAILAKTHDTDRKYKQTGPRDGSGPGVHATGRKTDTGRKYKQTGPQDGSGPGVYAAEKKALLYDILIKHADLSTEDLRGYLDSAGGGAALGALASVPNMMNKGLTPDTASAMATLTALGALTGAGSNAAIKDLGLEDNWMATAGITGATAAILNGLVEANKGSRHGWTASSRRDNAIRRGLAGALKGGVGGLVAGAAMGGLSNLPQYLRSEDLI